MQKSEWKLWLLSVCGLLLGLGLVLPAAPLHAQQPALKFVAGEVVALIPGPGKSVLGKVARKYGLAQKPLAEFGNRQIYRLRILDGTSPPDKAAQLLQDPRVKLAEPNYLSAVPEDSGRGKWRTAEVSTAAPSSWGLDAIHLAAAPTHGAGITVAVLDTGVDTKHPALQGKLVPGYDFVNNDRLPNEEGNIKKGGYGHGTTIAGIIAQVAPEAKIMPLRILDANGMGNMWVLADALQYAVDPNRDGNMADGARIINLSISIGRESQVLDQIISDTTLCYDDDEKPSTPDICVTRQGLTSQGVIVVAAAGNDHDGNPATPVPVTYPAAQPGVIGVAAIDQSDHKASFSNYSAQYVDISAPGVAITSLSPNKRYATWDGTSMAVPFVAAAAADFWANNLAQRASDVTSRLLSSVRPLDDLNPNYRGQLGRGMLDFQAISSFTALQLASLCTVDQQLARWRVRNANAAAVQYSWRLYGTQVGGTRVVPANADDIFDAPSGTMIIAANGYSDTKATNPAPCSAYPAPSATAGASPAP